MAYYNIKPKGAVEGAPGWSGVTEVILERDEETREPTKVARVGEAIELNEGDRKLLEKLGFEVETTTKKEAEEQQDTRPVGTDVAGSAPISFANAGATDQADDNDKNKK